MAYQTNPFDGDKRLTLNIRILKALYDRNYTSSSGKDVRLIIGKFRQKGHQGSYTYWGAFLTAIDNESDDKYVEVFKDRNTIPQLKSKLARKTLAELARARAEPEEFSETLTSIIESTLDREANDEDMPPGHEEKIEHTRSSHISDFDI